MSTAENICPVCKNSNEVDALICGHCGTILESPFMGSGTRTMTTNMPMPISEGTKEWSIDETAVPDHGIAVYMEGEFDPIHTDERDEFVIGRRSGKTAGVSDSLLDLAPLGGYARGVSRRHVVVRRAEQGYEVLDLGSVNGTWLNNGRLVPHKQYSLTSGAHLRLGSMRLVVLFRPSSEAKQES